MTAQIAHQPAAIRALPHVGGMSRRFKTSPTKLTPLAGKIMLASGALSTRRKAAGFQTGRIFGAMALLAVTTSIFLGGGLSIVRTPTVAVPVVEAPALAVGVVDKQDALAAKGRTETRAELPDLPSPAGTVEGQDRFEIDRFLRRGGASR
jgi:hypothetical protein